MLLPLVVCLLAGDSQVRFLLHNYALIGGDSQVRFLLHIYVLIGPHKWYKAYIILAKCDISYKLCLYDLILRVTLIKEECSKVLTALIIYH